MKEGGMSAFNKDHWEKDKPAVEMDDQRYASEFNTCEEYKVMVDKGNQYIKKNRMKYY